MATQGCGWIENSKEDTNGSSVPKYKKLPWQVAIYWVTTTFKNEELEIYDFCAGTLIHPRVVITQPKYDEEDAKTLRVKAGDWNLPKRTFVPQVSGVDSVAKIETRWYDLNMLFLSTSIVRTAAVNYACLPPPGLVTELQTSCLLESEHHDGGVAHQKPTKILEVFTIDVDDCRQKIKASQPLWTDVKMNASWTCVSNIEGHQNPCEGSNGTPLVCPYQDTPGRYYLGGVMSWYSSCYFGDGYGIFKTASIARTLIDEKMMEMGYCTDTYTM